MPTERLLITFPGKLGDLLYCLPLVRELGRRLACRPHLLTSPYCRPALELLQAQPYLGGVDIDHSYRMDDDGFGCQPWCMGEPEGYEQVLHLGLRPELVRQDFLSRHLSQTLALNLAQGYGLEIIPDLEEPCLFLPLQPREKLLVFNGLGVSFLRFAGKELPYWQDWWLEFFGLAGLPVLVISGPQERDHYGWLQAPLRCPENLLEAARLLAGCACFVGIESAAAAVANCLKSPRLILARMGNAYPTGPRGRHFNLGCAPAQAVQMLGELLHPEEAGPATPAPASGAALSLARRLSFWLPAPAPGKTKPKT